MLNIFNLKVKHNKPFITKDDLGNYAVQTRHNPPANKEWFNSIYAFNKNTQKLLPTVDKVIIKLIRSYFNLYSRKLEKNIRSPHLRTRLRRLSIKRFLVSKAESKHTSKKVIITLYLYNRQKKYYLKKMKKIATLALLKTNNFSAKLAIIKTKSLKVLSKVGKQKNIIIKTLRWDSKHFYNYEKTCYKNFIKKALKKEMLYLHHKQIVYLNKSKFENTYILHLKSLIETIYKKKVEFNLVTLKNLHLSSDIFSQALGLKLRNRRNKLIRVLKSSMAAVKVPSVKKLLFLTKAFNTELIINKQNLKFNDLLFNSFIVNKVKDENDIISKVLVKFFPLIVNYKHQDKINLENLILNSIKHKTVTGVRVEVAGRLTKRFTAARSLFKVKYKGSLKNIDSSYKGLSSVILRGNLKSNIQHTKLTSKIRIGSFGLKGWISSF